MAGYILQKCKDKGIKIPRITKSLDYRLMNVYSPEKIKEMQAIAKSRNGLCLSKRYITDRTNLQWQCENDHTWWARPHNIKNGTWCPYCAGKAPLTIEEMHRIAKSKGGKCLSKEYRGSNTKLKWQCKEDHVWENTPSHIKNRNQWCPICAREKRRKTFTK
jgi:hypothetical protein